MIQLQILSGKMAGNNQVVRHFPFRIGRAAGCEMQLEDDGVCGDHLTFEFQPQAGFILRAAPNAFVAVNEQPQTSLRLRNGDVISFGAVKMQFWLAAPQQRGLRLRELFAWAVLVAVTVFQIILIYRLSQPL